MLAACIRLVYDYRKLPTSPNLRRCHGGSSSGPSQTVSTRVDMDLCIHARTRIHTRARFRDRGEDPVIENQFGSDEIFTCKPTMRAHHVLSVNRVRVRYTSLSRLCRVVESPSPLSSSLVILALCHRPKWKRRMHPNVLA